MAQSPDECCGEREGGRRHLQLTLCCTEHWRKVALHYPLYCILLQIAEVVVAVRKVFGSSELVGNGGGGRGVGGSCKFLISVYLSFLLGRK